MIDDQLRRRLSAWHDQVEKVSEIESQYFEMEASEKHFYAQLFLKSEAKTVKEKEMDAYAREDWKDFKTGLAQLHSTLNKERRILEIRQKAFDAAYLTYKLEAAAISRNDK